VRNWMSLFGRFEVDGDAFLFSGGTANIPAGSTNPEVGNFLTNERFGGGKLTATVTFLDSIADASLQFILFFDTQTQVFVAAGIDRYMLCSVRTWNGNEWRVHEARGGHDQLRVGVPYPLEVEATGSRVSVTLNGVQILTTDLLFPLPKSQCGLWCQSYHRIRVEGFRVEIQKPTVFVVMQFTPPYNELYSEVIRPVCESFDLDVRRADEFYGPGLIIADIERRISESGLVVADISPLNPNVYYEVGYAHALRKPTILVADRETELPFDVSSFRTLFYENTIGGKSKIEDGLKKHLEAVLRKWPVT
jgi:hypothetical protein